MVSPSSDLAQEQVTSSKNAEVGVAIKTSPSESQSTTGKKKWWNRAGQTAEQKLLFKLDFFIMSWACYGYFLRLLDTSNMTNAYVSGMKEDLSLLSDQYNFFTTFWTIGYIVGMIPSQIIISRVRPSIWIPATEVLWAILTFCFAAVKNEKQIYAMRFLIGLFESPFYIGAMTLLGNWYTPSELAKRASIFYSASFAANMFSGYLQAAVYKGLNGVHGLAGWRWLFIMCGVITVPGALWGFFAVPDSPYNTKVWYLKEKDIELAKSRMVKLDRRPFKGITLNTFKRVFLNLWCLIFIVNYIFFCIDTTPLSFFAIWIKSLKRYSVAQVNLIPTGAYAIGFVATIIFGIVSDRLHTRPPIAVVITLINVLSSLLLAIHPSTGGVFYGYLANAATYAYGPIMISWLNEYLSSWPDERALVLGVAQTMGATFNAWLPLLIFNTGKQAPVFQKGFIVCTVVSVCQVGGIVGMWWLSSRGRALRDVSDKKDNEETEESGSEVPKA